jgi:hypothetical protein
VLPVQLRHGIYKGVILFLMTQFLPIVPQSSQSCHQFSQPSQQNSKAPIIFCKTPLYDSLSSAASSVQIDKFGIICRFVLSDKRWRAA